MSSLSKSTSSSSDEEAQFRRGPWTPEEDTLLIRYISCHGEGHWNLLAKRSGLRRTGKSCRLRWLNYLKPDVKRGNLTPQEQLLILELHCKWGNRWSKIAQYLPGRTDNEIKNYWRTRVQKQARHLNIDSNSAAFQELIQGIWMPRLLQKIQEGSSSPSVGALSQNLIISQPPPINHHLPSPPPQVRANEIANNPSISSSVSMNFAYINPQVSEYPTSPFQAMVGNSDHYNSTFLKGCYNVENVGYDMEMFNSSSASIVEAPGDFEDSISGCDIVNESNWITGNYNLGDGLWNMDESWQLSN